MVIHKDDANKARTMHRFVPGKGYQKLNPLNLPKVRAATEAACLPPAPVADGSYHLLQAAQGGDPIKMQWDAILKEWVPGLGSGGRRLGYTAEYLAAHGWVYVGPAE